jgi:hypothetical protein
MWPRYNSIEDRRRLAAINDSRLRPEFCRLWAREYPDDHDNGCPADRPPPATHRHNQRRRAATGRMAALKSRLNKTLL